MRYKLKIESLRRNAVIVIVVFMRKNSSKVLIEAIFGQNIEMNLRADMKTHYKNFQRVWNMLNTEWYRYLRVM